MLTSSSSPTESGSRTEPSNQAPGPQPKRRRRRAMRFLAVAAAFVAAMHQGALAAPESTVAPDRAPVIGQSTGSVDDSSDRGLVPAIEAENSSQTPDGAQPDHRGGPIIIIDPWWPVLDPLPRHCPHPCPRMIIRFPCGDPAAALLPPPPPGVPNPGATPGPTATLVPMPSPTPGGAASAQTYRVCPQVSKVIPQGVQDAAVAEPWRVYGYGLKSNPNIPFHPLWNPYRTWLSLRDPRQPYSVCNMPVWKSGCP